MWLSGCWESNLASGIRSLAYSREWHRIPWDMRDPQSLNQKSSHCLSGQPQSLMIWFCCCSVSQSCPTLCDPMDYSSSGFPVHHHLQKFAQTHVHWVSNAIQPSHLLLLPSPPALNLSQHQGLFQSVALRMRWPKYWSFSIALSNEYLGMISFMIDT